MTTSRVQDINNLIGRAVLSVETANKLGIVHDLVIDPLKGQLVGISVHTLDQRQVLVSQREIESIGPDAVMLKSEQSLGSAHPSPVQALPLAKNHLIGVKVVSEGGRLLGEIANIYIHQTRKVGCRTIGGLRPCRSTEAMNAQPSASETQSKI